MPNEHHAEQEPFVPLGSFVPDPITLQDVEEALKTAKIEFQMEGSRAYQILVVPKDAERAVSALKKSRSADKITIYAKS